MQFEMEDEEEFEADLKSQRQCLQRSFERFRDLVRGRLISVSDIYFYIYIYILDW